MAVRVHHLSCGTMCPLGGRLVAGEGPPELVCHCLLVETARAGLVLVDTGLGTADCRDPGRLPAIFRTFRPRFDEAETARARVERLGFRASDVRHVVVTHLDLDHAGGLADFPDAEVHVFAREHEAAMAPGLRERARYVPAQWAHGPRWRAHEVLAGERWKGFELARAIDGSDDEVLVVPLVGHSRGHAAVAVRAGAGWLLHAGDAYFHARELEGGAAPPLLSFFERVVAMDDRARRENLRRLVELAAGEDDVRVFCAHSKTEYDALAR
jgi:glyoxylase-like metal-dependent hydrolase (beta-lactamase superfamily II)